MVTGWSTIHRFEKSGEGYIAPRHMPVGGGAARLCQLSIVPVKREWVLPDETEPGDEKTTDKP